MKFERVKELRKKGGLNQQALADLLGVGQRTYSRYERGENDMSPETLIILADYYGVSVDYILGRTDEPN